MRTVTVVGQGTARAVPDTAVVRVAAVHRAPALADALAGAESARAAIVRAAATATVTSQDLSVWPATDEHGSPDGFEARHSLALRCGDLTEAGKLVGALARKVGDRLVVDGVSLDVADPSTALTAAREAAFADARARAGHLAVLSGAVLGEVQSVVEGSGASAPRMFAAKSDATFVPGETTIEQSLTVTFQLA